MEDVITTAKLDKYFDITTRAYNMAKESGNRLPNMQENRLDFLDMIKRYIDDAHYFRSKDDYVNAFAALSYAHGWLDSGARIGLFDVHDNVLFTVD